MPLPYRRTTTRQRVSVSLWVRRRRWRNWGHDSCVHSKSWTNSTSRTCAPSTARRRHPSATSSNRSPVFSGSQQVALFVAFVNAKFGVAKMCVLEVHSMFIYILYHLIWIHNILHVNFTCLWKLRIYANMLSVWVLFFYWLTESIDGKTVLKKICLKKIILGHSKAVLISFDIFEP